ncbi:hypothetical protein BDL97_05G129200 [Sphagnum fallax]|nr:hypothetical protein BDL97_05G129200 [Sphagnum fallax]
MLCIRFLAAPDSLRDVTYITNFAALEIRHISRRKMIRVGNPVLQHLSGACRLPHPEKRSRQEEMIPSSSVTVKKLLEWLMGLEADRCWS